MSTDVTKDLLEALKGLMALSDHRVDLRDAAKAAQATITRAEAALAEPQPDADGWIPWVGAECPVDEKALVEVKLRSGSAWIDQEAQMGADWLWDHDGGPDDIIAYRVVKHSDL